MMIIDVVVSQADALVNLVPEPDILAQNIEPRGNLPGEVQRKLRRLLGWLRNIALIAAVGGVIITGARMAMAWRSGNDTNMAQLGFVLLGCILVGSASAIVGAIMNF